MPRNHSLGTSTLRNRNRVTNKTRLKVIQGNIDADPLVLDEDEEKARIVSTAGVDAEDANEHHLQAVLSAASHRHQSVGRTTRGVIDKPPAYIPTPDSTGVIDNYEEFYPPNCWKQPEPYVRFSETVDESCTNAVIDGFTYFMDERDKEWLDRNNGEARGEGTSAQGALPVSGTTTRSGLSQRSAKAKGKEPDCNQPVTITEDEFELVMGLFEKVTHDKTPFLHTGLDSGMSFPPFSDYQDVFSSPLLPSMFAAFAVPPWIPQPFHLLRIAKGIYPYWRERRIERGGHRIIPTLNFDETDTNESYICFRRREIKTARKTRASQATSSDKLLRLQLELAQASELAKYLLARENLQKENAQQTMQVWEKRIEFADLKRKFPSLSTKEDEELLHDKERVVKKPKIEPAGRITGLKIRARDNDAGSPVVAAEAVIRPKERLALINAAVERDLAKRKERDHGYEDVVESAYQRPSLPYSRRHWKAMSLSSRATPSLSRVDDVGDDAKPEHVRYLRYRLTRLGGVMLDRRDAFMQRMGISDDDGALLRRRHAFGQPLDDGFGDAEDEEMRRRLRERWRFDQDDDPAVAPEGPEEQDLVLIDDYEPKYLRHMMTLLTEQDHQLINNDATLYVLQDGRTRPVTPYRIGVPQPMGRKEQQNSQRVYTNGTSPLAASRQMSASVPLPSIPNGMPISMQAHMKGIQPPSAVPHARICSNGNVQPQGTPNASSSEPSQRASSSPLPTKGLSASPATAPIADGDAVKLSSPNGTPGIPPTPEVQTPSQPSGTPRLKADPQQAVSIPLNGYHHVPINGYAIPNISFTPHPRQLNGLSPQQMKDLRSAFAQDPSSGMQGTPGRQIQAPYVGHLVPNGTHFNMQMGAGANVNLKLPPGRQWNGVASPLQQAPNLGSVPDGGGTQILFTALPLHQSPPRPPPTPTLKMASPSMQQSVPSSQGGY